MSDYKELQKQIRTNTLENFEKSTSIFKGLFASLTESKRNIAKDERSLMQRLPQKELNKKCAKLLGKYLAPNENFNGCTLQKYPTNPDTRRSFSPQPFQAYLKTTNSKNEFTETAFHEALHNETTNAIGAMNFDFGQRVKSNSLCTNVRQRANDIRKDALRKFLDLNDSLDAKPLFNEGKLNQEQKKFTSRPLLLDYIKAMESLEDECSDYLQ